VNWDNLNVEDLRLPEDLVEKLNRRSAGSKAKRDRHSFHKFPVGLLESVAKTRKDPILAVCCALLRKHFDGHGENPVFLTSKYLEEYHVSRGQKIRALKFLESTGFFIVGRIMGKNPLITLNWLPLKPQKYG
jgi:hypothetical protein